VAGRRTILLQQEMVLELKQGSGSIRMRVTMTQHQQLTKGVQGMKHRTPVVQQQLYMGAIKIKITWSSWQPWRRSMELIRRRSWLQQWRLLRLGRGPRI
jgi:hypothetical protein